MKGNAMKISKFVIALILCCSTASAEVIDSESAEAEWQNTLNSCAYVKVAEAEIPVLQKRILTEQQNPGGIVDKEVLHELGTTIQQIKSAISKKKLEYKKTQHKDLNCSDKRVKQYASDVLKERQQTCKGATGYDFWWESCN